MKLTIIVSRGGAPVEEWQVDVDEEHRDAVSTACQSAREEAGEHQSGDRYHVVQAPQITDATAVRYAAADMRKTTGLPVEVRG